MRKAVPVHQHYTGTARPRSQALRGQQRPRAGTGTGTSNHFQHEGQPPPRAEVLSPEEHKKSQMVSEDEAELLSWIHFSETRREF